MSNAKLTPEQLEDPIVEANRHEIEASGVLDRLSEQVRVCLIYKPTNESVTFRCNTMNIRKFVTKYAESFIEDYTTEGKLEDFVVVEIYEHAIKVSRL